MEKQREIVNFSVLNFTEYPGPRYSKQGDHSGEQFYSEVLKEKFQEVLDSSNEEVDYVLAINLDNTAGYASSFLDEAFGRLVFNFSKEKVSNHLEIISNQEPDWIEIINKEVIPEWETKRIAGN